MVEPVSHQDFVTSRETALRGLGSITFPEDSTLLVLRIVDFHEKVTTHSKS